MKIELVEYSFNENYFESTINGETANSSRGISMMLNLDVDIYNKLLIEKVIKHDNYAESEYSNDYEFNLCNIPKEIYIERFKETFINELTLLVLRGN